MPITRHHLPWSEPLLPRAAAWLHSHPSNHSRVVAVPTARAGRRLRELIAERGDPRRDQDDWQPPHIVTVGHLPEALLAPQVALAGPIDHRLALATCLMHNADLRESLWQTEQPTALGAWRASARLQQALDVLAAGSLRADDATVLANAPQPSHRALARWTPPRMLTASQQRETLPITDTSNWLHRHTSSDVAEVVLIGCGDLPPVVAACLRQAASSSLHVHALVVDENVTRLTALMTSACSIPAPGASGISLADDQIIAVASNPAQRCGAPHCRGVAAGTALA